VNPDKKLDNLIKAIRRCAKMLVAFCEKILKGEDID